MFEESVPATDRLQALLEHFLELYVPNCRDVTAESFIERVVRPAMAGGIGGNGAAGDDNLCVLSALATDVVAAQQIMAEIRRVFLRLGQVVKIVPPFPHTQTQLVLEVADAPHLDYDLTQNDEVMVRFLIERAEQHGFTLDRKQAAQLLWRLVRKGEKREACASPHDPVWPLWVMLASDNDLGQALLAYSGLLVAIRVNPITVEHV